jgi:hypothetical protein
MGNGDIRNYSKKEDDGREKRKEKVKGKGRSPETDRPLCNS